MMGAVLRGRAHQDADTAGAEPDPGGPQPQAAQGQSDRQRQRPLYQQDDDVCSGGGMQEEYSSFIRLQPTMAVVLGLLFESLQQSILTEPLCRVLESLLYGATNRLSWHLQPTCSGSHKLLTLG
jgi:hypothetical protein